MLAGAALALAVAAAAIATPHAHPDPEQHGGHGGSSCGAAEHDTERGAADPAAAARGRRGPFGSTHAPAGPIAELAYSDLTPRLFVEGYINTRRPLVVRGMAAAWPAVSRWTDAFLDTAYGHFTATMESKREDDPLPKSKTTLHEYFTTHQHHGYIVSELPELMYRDVHVPTCLQCGLLRDRLSEMNLWLSSGNTSSMLHRDGFNQMNCLVKGTKRWTVIDAHHIPQIPFIWEDGQDPLYTRGGVVDFTWEDIDFDMHPNLASIPYSQATLVGGDCIFVPGDHPHQVVSPAPVAGAGAAARSTAAQGAKDTRNIQVSFLFGGVTAFARGTDRENKPLKWDAAGQGCDNLAVGTSKPLAGHPVSWVYPGFGPSTLGSIDLISVKLLLLQTVAGEQPWRKQGEGEDDEEGGEAADSIELPGAVPVGGCVQATLDLAKGVLRADKGFPAHDLLQLEEYVDLVLRDDVFNVGSWKEKWGGAVTHVANEPDTYIHDTVVIPGLRQALLGAVESQARRVCTALSMSTLEAMVSPKDVAVAGGGGGHEGGPDHNGPLIPAPVLRAFPERYVSHYMLALVTMFNFADATRFANFVARDATGRWRAVRGPDGEWAGSQPEDGAGAGAGEG